MSASSSPTSPRLNGGRLPTAARMRPIVQAAEGFSPLASSSATDPTALARCISTITIERSSSGDAALRAWTSGRAA